MSPVSAGLIAETPQWTAVLYGRKSKFNGRVQGKNPGRSVGEQDERNRLAAERLGAVIAAAYEDDEISAFAEDAKPRPGWQNVLDSMRGGQCNLLITWEPSRPDRLMDRWVPFITECGKRRVAIFITDHPRSDPYLPWEDHDRISLLELGLGSEREVRVMRGRIRRAKRANAAAGRPNSSPLYGYRRVYDHRGKLLEIIAEPAEELVIGEIAARYSRAEAVITIVNDLNDRAVLAPQAAAAARELATCDDPERRAVLEERLARVKWTTVQVRRLVSNPAYLGKMVYRGEVVGDAMWPPLITGPVYEACRAVTARRRDAYKGNGPGRDGAARYLLSCIAVCGVCGRPLVPGGYRNPHMSYICQPIAGKGGNHVGRVMGRLDEYVTEAVLARVGRPDFLSLIGDKDSQREADAILAGVAEKEARLRAAAESHALHGVPSLELLTLMQRELDPVIKADRAAARRLIGSASPLLADLLADPAMIRAVWENDLTLAQKRTLIRLLAKRIALYPAARRSGQPLRDTVVIEWAGKDSAG